MLGIFLDDERSPDEVMWVDYPEVKEWLLVRNHDDFITLISNQIKKNSDFCISVGDTLNEYQDGFEIDGHYCLLNAISLVQSLGFTANIECFVHSEDKRARDAILREWDGFMRYWYPEAS